MMMFARTNHQYSARPARPSNWAYRYNTTSLNALINMAGCLAQGSKTTKDPHRWGSFARESSAASYSPRASRPKYHRRWRA
jgi:hypothetical protein